MAETGQTGQEKRIRRCPSCLGPVAADRGSEQRRFAGVAAYTSALLLQADPLQRSIPAAVGRSHTGHTAAAAAAVHRIRHRMAAAAAALGRTADSSLLRPAAAGHTGHTALAGRTAARSSCPAPAHCC